MPVISKLSALLTLNSSQFRSGVQRAMASTKELGASVARVGARVAAFGSIATGAAVAGLSALVKSQFKTVDALAKTADKIGTTTEELAGLRFAAEQTGVANRTLDMALQRMTRRIGEAALGTGEAKDAIKQLGLSAQELATMSPAEALKQIAGRMQEVQGQSQRVRLAFKLFDSEGVSLVNTLMLGSQGIEDAMKRAEELGLTLSRVDAEKIVQANDALNELKQVFIGAGRALAIELAPFVTATTKKLTEMGIAGEGMGNALINVFERVLLFVAKFSDGISLIKGAWFALRSQILKGLSKIIGAIAKMGEAVNFLLKQIGVEVQPLKDLEEFYETFAENIADTSKENFGKAVKAMEEWVAGTTSRKIKTFFSDIRKGAEAAAQAAVDKLNQIKDSATRTFDPETLTKARNKLASLQDKLAKQRADHLAQAALGVEARLGRTALTGLTRGSKRPPTFEQTQELINDQKKVVEALERERMILAA